MQKKKEKKRREKKRNMNFKCPRRLPECVCKEVRAQEGGNGKESFPFIFEAKIK